MASSASTKGGPGSRYSQSGKTKSGSSQRVRQTRKREKEIPFDDAELKRRFNAGEDVIGEYFEEITEKEFLNDLKKS